MKPKPLAATGISLRALLAGELGCQCPADLRVTSCTSDWRQVQPGDVFVAIISDDEDGHAYAIEAAERGAMAIISERPLPVFHVPQFTVADSRTFYGRLCQTLVGDPSRQLKVIGITGSHGKTTVARLLSAVLREAGHCVGTLDSFGYWDGVEDEPATNGPLTPTVLAHSLAEMVARGMTHAVVEISSLDLARQTFAGVTLDAVCLTQLGTRHVDWHGSGENLRSAQRRALELLDAEAVAIVNADDPTSVRLLDELTRPVLTFGLQGSGEVSAQVVEQFVNEQSFLLSAGDDSVGVRTEIVGDHHIQNCLAAATTALVYGVDLITTARGLESVSHLPGRMEHVRCGQGFAVLVDSADSPEALRYCLRAARGCSHGRVICVFGANETCDVGQLPAIGRVLGAMSDVAAITHGTPAEPGSHRLCLEVRSGFADLGKAHVILDRCEAIRWALREAAEGDVVIIAGMGEEPHTPLGAEGALANDGELIRAALQPSHLLTSRRLVA
ncbi:MAG: UDP-N-acetylmuramyl-tripeptide synthetase [Pirellulales bacterium]|nr:UDP-N-acetylmuramyl-tripeptide synthetase [Pirellulales bacterium]